MSFMTRRGMNPYRGYANAPPAVATSRARAPTPSTNVFASLWALAAGALQDGESRATVGDDPTRSTLQLHGLVAGSFATAAAFTLVPFRLWIVMPLWAHVRPILPSVCNPCSPTG
jgi:hypothetical protein